MSDEALKELFTSVAERLESLHEQSETGDGGQARVLFYALAAYLDERGIIDHLKAAAAYMAKNENLRNAHLGGLIH